jgi:kynurenine formamidase
MTANDPSATVRARPRPPSMGGGEVVDLTVTLAEHLPSAWPTHVPFQRKIFNWYAPQEGQIQPIHALRGPYQTAWLTLDEHCGTHFDAPTHFIPPPDSGLPHASDLGLQTGDTIALDRLMGPAAVIDATELTGQGANGVSPEITPDLIQRWETDHGQLQPGEIVLFRSDWDDFYRPMPQGSAYVFDPFVLAKGPGWPTPGIPALQHLLDRGIRTIGLDGTSVGASHDGAPPHQFGLGRGMLYIELLANLRRLPPRGAYFIFLPIKIGGSTGGPGRAIALLPASET